MTITYVYGTNLYVNPTNRCDCNCTFCLRATGDGVGTGSNLWLEREPTREEMLGAILSEDLTRYEQLVFVGYGEPTYRLHEILWVAREVKKCSPIPIRLDTNGHSDLIWGMPTAPLLQGAFDIVSVSLNNASPEAYQQAVRCRYGVRAYQAMLDFTREAVQFVPTVQMTVVDTIPPEEIEACRRICEDLGAQLRVRKYSTEW